MSKSEEKKPALPVSQMFSELSAGGELTPVQVLNSLAVSDKNLALKTQIDDVMAVTVLDVLISYAKSKKYTRTAKLLSNLLRAYRENMCSFKGWRSNQIIQGLVADMERARRESEELAERLGVKRSKR